MLSTIAGWSPAVVAHQGGWDEILLVAGPIAVVVALLWIAKRRVDDHGPRAGAGVEAPPEPPRSVDPAPPVDR